jgi:hypothetical protein
VWPTEPARAGWSFNKWQKTRIPKQLRRHLSNRPRNVHAAGAARAVAAAPADVVVAAVAAEVGRVPVVDVALPGAADKVVVEVAPGATAARAAAAADGVKAKAVTVKAGAEMVEASSSRT